MPSLRYFFFTVAKSIKTFLGNFLKIKTFNNFVFQLKSLSHTCAKPSQFNEKTDFQIWHWSWRDKLLYKLLESYKHHNRCLMNNCCAGRKRFPYVNLALWGQAPSACTCPFVPEVSFLPSLSLLGSFFFFFKSVSFIASLHFISWDPISYTPSPPPFTPVSHQNRRKFLVLRWAMFDYRLCQEGSTFCYINDGPTPPKEGARRALR